MRAAMRFVVGNEDATDTCPVCDSIELIRTEDGLECRRCGWVEAEELDEY